MAKHRSGSVGDVRLRWIAEYTKFVDLEDNFIGALTDDNAEPTIQTFGSKMNEKAPALAQNTPAANDDLHTNTGFSEEVPF